MFWITLLPGGNQQCVNIINRREPSFNQPEFFVFLTFKTKDGKLSKFVLSRAVLWVSLPGEWGSLSVYTVWVESADGAPLQHCSAFSFRRGAAAHTTHILAIARKAVQPLSAAKLEEIGSARSIVRRLCCSCSQTKNERNRRLKRIEETCFALIKTTFPPVQAGGDQTVAADHHCYTLRPPAWCRV